MKVKDLFDVKYGINLELNACEITADTDGVNFVSRTSENNGVVARVKIIPDKKPQLAGVITCAAGGSVLSSFVQNEPFYSGRDLYILTPKKTMSLEEKLFYCKALKMNAYRYQYGRQANKTLKEIELPDVPDWVKKYKIDYSPIQTKIKTKPDSLDISAWKQFKISDLFECSTTPAVIETQSGSIPYVTRTSTNNGVDSFISEVSKKINKNNCITIGAEGRFAFYQSKPFISGVKIYTLRNESLNKYNALFISTILNKEVYRYCYGRARILDKIKEERIKLPVNSQGNPDWQFMENYIKSLPYSDLI